MAIIDTSNQQIKHTLTFEIPGISASRIQPVGMELTKDGKLAFIALGPANHVAVVDRTNNYEVIDYILVGRRVWHLALTEDESRLYTSNGVSGDVTLVDVEALKPVKTIKVGRFPWGVAILPESAIPQ